MTENSNTQQRTQSNQNIHTSNKNKQATRTPPKTGKYVKQLLLEGNKMNETTAIGSKNSTLNLGELFEQD